MGNQYNRTESLNRFIDALYRCAKKELEKNEPDFTKEFKRWGEIDLIEHKAVPLIKGKMRKWEVLLEKTYEVELYFVKLGYAAMSLSMDPPKEIVGYQPMTEKEFFQYHHDSFFIVLASLIDRLKGLTKHIERNFVSSKVISSSKEETIRNDMSIVIKIQKRIENSKNRVTKIRDPMVHEKSPGAGALEEEKFWYSYLALDERLDMVKIYYSGVTEERRKFRRKVVNGIAEQMFNMVEEIFKEMNGLGFLRNI